jgi:diaminohydroxyphosphoribosylaminopyrimidine deaminase/5-amino-6-(5-phosphoribosylamino)uracil reductase
MATSLPSPGQAAGLQVLQLGVVCTNCVQQVMRSWLVPAPYVLGRAPSDARIHPCTEWSGSLPDLLDTLGNEGVLQLMVEGGANVAAQFHAAGLIDRYVFHIAPVIMGGSDAVPAFAGDTAATLADVWRGRLVSTQRLGDDVEVVIEPERSPS